MQNTTNLLCRKISYQEKISWIRLLRSKNVSRSTFFKLLKSFGNINEALDNATHYCLKKNPNKPIHIFEKSKAEKELENCHKIGARIITFIEPEYPKLLRQIADPPPIITVRGNISLLNKEIICIVGPRNASIMGCKFAHQIAKELGNNDLIIASGLARGIDTAAHYGSLATGTIAVIAGGINHIYPRQNEELYYKIADSGLIISEMEYGSCPRASHFPQRNRIISGISLGTAVIEATLKSGTLITARLATEQNREVFAVPGSPLDPRSQGTNQLIKQGAKLLESVCDILEEIKPQNSNQTRDSLEIFKKQNEAQTESINNDRNEKIKKLILSKINYTAIYVDEIICQLQISAKIINSALLELELEGRIENKNGKICLLS